MAPFDLRAYPAAHHIRVTWHDIGRPVRIERGLHAPGGPRDFVVVGSARGEWVDTDVSVGPAYCYRLYDDVRGMSQTLAAMATGESAEE